MATLISRLRCGARDRDLYAVAALFWLVSLLRVVEALAHHEVFGPQATAALLSVVIVPWALLPGSAAVVGSQGGLVVKARAR
jgi:hypothetical protein